MKRNYVCRVRKISTAGSHVWFFFQSKEKAAKSYTFPWESLLYIDSSKIGSAACSPGVLPSSHAWCQCPASLGKTCPLLSVPEMTNC